MKKYIIITVASILIYQLSYSQNWQWAKHLGGYGGFNNERAYSVITDDSNYYVIGAYWNNLFMPADTFNSNGLNDAFIVKFDGSGNQLWAKSLGGTNNQPSAYDDAYGVYDPVNNCIFVAGSFVNSISFNGTVNLNSFFPNGEDIFLAKMDLNGNFIWAKRGGSFGNDNTQVFAQPDGNILLAGHLNDTGYVDTATVSPGGFFARFDSNGNLIWAAHKFSGPDDYEITIDFISSDIIMGGSFSSGVTSYVDTATLISNGSFDGFLTRMDSLGNVEWIFTFGDTGVDALSGLTIDNSNNIYITGGFKDSINLDGVVLTNSTQDILIAKFDENANLIWAKQAFATGSNEGGLEIVSDGDGNCYITGVFSGGIVLDTFHINTTNSFDMFLTRYDNNGSCLGVRHFGTASGSHLTVDISGNVVCVGAFQNTVDIGGNIFTSYGGNDIYVAKIDAITGIGEGEGRVASNQLIIYANPNNGKCNITVPDDFLHEKKLTLSIFDNTGKIIQQKTLEMNDGKIKLNLEAEAKGVYNVILNNGTKSYSGKIIFE